MTFDKMKEIVLNDHETKGYDIPEADLLKVYQYIVMRDNNDTVDGYIPKLRLDPYVEIYYLPTDAKVKADLKAKMQRHLDYFDSEIFLQDVALSDFEIFNDERKKAYELAVDFLANYRKDKFYKGLYIYGKYATGKTYLLSAIAQELAKRDVNILFVFMPDLVRSIKAGMNAGDMESRINRLKQADVLMIDDVGGEHITAWFRDEILLPVIQYRLSARLPIFFSSNLSMEKLVNALATTKNEYDLTKAVRIVQRIRDLTTYVELSDQQYKK